MFVTTIESLGLTEKESKLYLTSLRLGPVSMQTLARKAGIDRGTAYHVAKTLSEKGLFSLEGEGKRPVYGATNPRNLYNYVETKKKEADRHWEAMQQMIGDLDVLYEIGSKEGQEELVVA